LAKQYRRVLVQIRKSIYYDGATMKLEVTCETIAIVTEPGSITFYCRKPEDIHIFEVVK